MVKRQIFLCYASQDESRVLPLYEKLVSKGLRPWMDRKKLQAGDNWESGIRKAIRESEFFLLILTGNSVDKRGVIQKEIKWALDYQDEQLPRDRFVIPVRLEERPIPERVAHLQSADLYKPGTFESLVWNLLHGDEEASGVEVLAEESIGERPAYLPFGGIPAPCFFPSISGASKNPLSALKHLRILRALKHPLFLVSAYDLMKIEKGDERQKREERLKFAQSLADSMKSGQFVLMDSGNYEKRWLKDTWYKKNFYEVLRSTPCNIAFCFDDVSPSGNPSKIVKDITRGIKLDRRHGQFQNIIPIIHANRPHDFPAICKGVVEELSPPLIAVPERELGEGIIDGAQTMMRLRGALDGSGKSCPIHVLGTGNPLSILIYVYCGADSFDGLDWCQTVVDHESGRLYHSQHLDFFSDQTDFGTETSLSYFTRQFGHNLQFFDTWMKQIGDAMESGTLDNMLEEYLPSKTAAAIREIRGPNRLQ